MNIKKGVIHIGAHIGQEAEEYGSLNVLWIEPIPSVFQILCQNIQDFPSQKALNHLISDVDGEEYSFYVSSQSARSSFLKFTSHHFNDPNFSHTETLKMQSIRMDTLIQRYKINLQEFDTLVTDCQGADYFILKSFGEYISHFSFIKSEVMTSSIYEGLREEREVNQYLESKNFTLISDFEYQFNSTQRDNIYKNRKINIQ